MGKLQDPRKAPRRNASRLAAAKAPAKPKLLHSQAFPTIPMEDLVRQQGARPLHDLEEFAALWPADFDPDEFQTWLSAERKARRQLRSNSARKPA